MTFGKTHDIAELTTELIGKQVVLGGWIEDIRKLGKMTFITLRDVSGISLIIVKGELNDTLGEINRQSVVRVKGIVQETKAVISGKWTPRFPIDTEKVVQIVKNARNLDIEIEFEDKR